MEIWVSASDGSNPSQLTKLKSARSGTPRWSPDGKQIAFDSLASGNNDIWVVGSDGGTPKRVTTELSNEARPSWSHDGRWIYFRSDRSGSQQIWKVPATEPFQPAVQVTRNGGFAAVESTDGRR
jgi:Tol biopolymer transport system component